MHFAVFPAILSRILDRLNRVIAGFSLRSAFE
jgi:hypothetical protein